MEKIIISPYSRKLRDGAKPLTNPKNYPYWNELIQQLKPDYHIIQIGIDGEVKLNDVDEFIIGETLNNLEKLVKECSFWISVDNFFQHFCAWLAFPGIVIFGKSDPLIFGHDINLNILKDRKYLRKNQFDIWESEPYDIECFINPDEVINSTKLLGRTN